ncbi:MAG: hypothetical protein L6R39_005845 [Caloplaca ligustica]|nr:MAG: hypothetical protein L6R39_005845 [Caloplaca ligustica]
MEMSVTGMLNEASEPPCNCPFALAFLPKIRIAHWFSSNSMAITFADGVILGADSRTTTGAYIANRVTDKLTRVSDTIWCCRSGSAADTQAVADAVTYYLSMYATMEGQQPSVGVAAGLFQEVCYSNKEQLS